MERSNGTNAIVKFEPNIPVEIRLKYPDGLNVQGQFGPRVMFTLEDGRRMYVDADVAASIRMMGFQPGQPFTITKCVGANRKPQWDVNPATTRPEEIGPALARSIQQRKPPQNQSAPQPVEARGTGTYGPAPVARPAPPQKVPMNLAFGEIVSLVNAELKARGEQWNDEARQAAVSTLLIHAGREGWLTLWERGK